MAIYDGDQQQTRTAVINGVHASLTPAALKAIEPANTVYVFSSAYSFHYNGQIQTFKRGTPYALDAGLKAALLAASAPMVAA